MPHRVDAHLSLATAVVALLALLVVPGSTAWSGPVLLRLTAAHGVHLLDLGVVALGLALAVAVARRAWPQPVVLRVASVPRPRAATA
jgi:hypothetical protein